MSPDSSWGHRARVVDGATSTTRRRRSATRRRRRARGVTSIFARHGASSDDAVDRARAREVETRRGTRLTRDRA